jgi:hypothetical protein
MSRRDLSGPLAGISFAGGLATSLAAADAPFPRPGSSPEDIRRFFEGNAGPARVNVAGQLVSAGALARFTGTVARLAGGSRPLRTAAIASGGAAVASLATSALTSLALTRAGGRSDDEVVALHRRMFVAGGAVHTAAFGTLIGTLSLAGRRTKALPAPLTTAGLASAGVGALSPLSLVVPPAVLLLPAARISGLVVAGIAGARLGR